MALSIFFSLSLPREEDAEAKLAAVLLDARVLAKGSGFEVGPMRTLSAEDCVHSQASMDEDFSFARSVCQPPGGNRSSIGTVPETAVYFRVAGKFDIGLARYERDAVLEVLSEDGQDAVPYDGRWYFWAYFDGTTRAEKRLLKLVLKAAGKEGIEVAFKDEAD